MKYLVSFAINQYPKESERLQGCLNDQLNIIRLFSEYSVSKLSDSEVTIQAVTTLLLKIVEQAKPGDQIVIHYSGHGTQVVDLNGDESDGYDEALYLYDGPFVDDSFCTILMNLKEKVDCLVLLDSCFSGTATRSLNKSKFISLFSHDRKRNRPIISVDQMKWSVISGCKENQTSADAYIDSKYEGAFTHFLCKSAKKGQTIRQWYKNLCKTDIESYQSPQIEGSNLNMVVL